MMGMRLRPIVGGPGRDLVAVAVNAGKNSQEALKWALEKLVPKGQGVIVLHVRKKITAIPTPDGHKLPLAEVSGEVASIFLQQCDEHTKDIFVPLRCICNRRRVLLKEVVLDDLDIPKAIVNFAKHQTVDKLVLGVSSKNAFIRTFRMDLPAYVSKNAPEFCSVYVISKGKIYSQRPAPHQYLYPAGRPEFIFETNVTSVGYARSEPDTCVYTASAGSSPLADYASKDRLSGGGIHMGHRYHSTASCPTPSVASMDSQSDCSSQESFIVGKHPYYFAPNMPKKFTSSDGSMTSFESKTSGYSCSSNSSGGYAGLPPRSQQKETIWKEDDVDLEINRMKLQLQQSTRLFEDSFIQMQGTNKLRIQKYGINDGSDIEIYRTEAFLEEQGSHNFRSPCRNYSIEEVVKATNNFSDSMKIADGAVGTVFRSVDHSSIVIKVLQSDSDQSTGQFELKAAGLTRMHHPNVLSFAGICPEVKCLICEHSFNGFLQDRLFFGSTSPIPWKYRLKIAADIASGLLFLQEFRGEPLDLKPGNVLLTHNFTAKVSPFPMKSSPGWSAYIDPEYQRTGSMSMASDVYALGIILLQLITAAPPVGAVLMVRRAMDTDRIAETIDDSALEWPLGSVKELALLALRCTELHSKDRPDLGSAVLPGLKCLHDLHF